MVEEEGVYNQEGVNPMPFFGSSRRSVYCVSFFLFFFFLSMGLTALECAALVRSLTPACF